MSRGPSLAIGSDYRSVTPDDLHTYRNFDALGFRFRLQAPAAIVHDIDHPSLRPFTDLDLLVRDGEFEMAVAQVSAQGGPRAASVTGAGVALAARACGSEAHGDHATAKTATEAGVEQVVVDEDGVTGFDVDGHRG